MHMFFFFFFCLSETRKHLNSSIPQCVPHPFCDAGLKPGYILWCILKSSKETDNHLTSISSLAGLLAMGYMSAALTICEILY